MCNWNIWQAFWMELDTSNESMNHRFWSGLTQWAIQLRTLQQEFSTFYEISSVIIVRLWDSSSAIGIGFYRDYKYTCSCSLVNGELGTNGLVQFNAVAKDLGWANGRDWRCGETCTVGFSNFKWLVHSENHNDLKLSWQSFTTGFLGSTAGTRNWAISNIC